MKRKVFIAIILIVGGFFVYNMFKPLSVEITEVGTQNFIKETVLTGKLVLVNQSSIKSTISGDIKEVLVTNGQQVEKGDVLIKIDSSEYYQNYAVIEKDIEKAVSALDQYIDLNRDNLNNPEIIHGRNQLEIALQQAKSKKIAGAIGFNDYNIKATISGKFYFTGSTDLYQGEYVTLNSEIGKIYNSDILKVKVGVTPDEFSALVGVQSVKVHIEGYDDVNINAQIGQVSDSIEKNENGDDVMYVTFDIFDTVADIYKKDGLNAKVFIEKDAGKMLSVPFSAIFSEKSVDYVYLVRNNKAYKTAIKIIEDFGDNIAVDKNDLKEKDRIVKNIVEGLKDGKRVKSK